MTDKAELTIGQEFAARWIVKNHGNHRDSGTPADLFEMISRAVEVYVDKQRALFLSRLREVVVKTGEGENLKREIAFDSESLLTNEALLQVVDKMAKRIPSSGLQGFPSNKES